MTYEQLHPLYRVTEYRDGEVYRTEPVEDRWLPLGTVVGSEVEPGVRVGTPDRLQIRVAGS